MPATITASTTATTARVFSTRAASTKYLTNGLSVMRFAPACQLPQPHPEEHRAAMRLEGWQYARCSFHPSRRALRALLRVRWYGRDGQCWEPRKLLMTDISTGRPATLAPNGLVTSPHSLAS